LFRNKSLYNEYLEPGLSGTTTWRSPSNIALIKYWGKKNFQVPANPSLSFVLSASYTETRVTYRIRKNKGLTWNFTFEGRDNASFHPKIEKFFQTIRRFVPFIDYLDLEISSMNSFPHSAGIASSASAMSALALSVMQIEEQILGQKTETEEFYTKASFLARLGSGSASRSVFPGFSIWGETPVWPESSDLSAREFKLSPESWFYGLRDAILIVDSAKKKISSSTGHELMNSHPFASDRLKQVEKNLSGLLDALNSKRKDDFINIVENEALSLHALMMSSYPGYSLLRPGTLNIIDRIRDFREESGVFICFTLDAGPNVHLLYHEEDRSVVEEFIRNNLLHYCEKENVIWDHLGKGPEMIN
jgi:diphosphomevalonate decarboxylase